MTKLVTRLCRPEILAAEGDFIIKFATSDTEKIAAQRLRYQVFHQEQTRGGCGNKELDCDIFDDYCLHLIVVSKNDNEVVGTYRVHPGTIAAINLGFYTATEFELDGIDEIVEQSVELGRSCVAKTYRNGTVIAALWAGIAQIMIRGGFRYLLGCVSLEENDAAAAWALFEKLKRQNKLTPTLVARPRRNFLLPSAPDAEIARYRPLPLRRQLPPLFRGYLSLGGKICGPPVYDRCFGTIDFLVLLDIELMPERYSKHFKCGKNNAHSTF